MNNFKFGILAAILFPFCFAEEQGPNNPPPRLDCAEIHALSNERKTPSRVDSIVSDPQTRKVFDSLFNLEGDRRFVKKFGTKPPVFYGAAFRTLSFPSEKVIEKIEDCRSYMEMFKYIRDFQIISENEQSPQCLTAYSSIGAFMFRSWFIVNLDSICTDEQGRWGQYFSKNHMPPLNAVWDKRDKPYFTYLAREITIRFFVRRIDEKTSRVGCLLAVDPKSSVPGWIFGMVGKRVFPRFLKDLQKALEAEASPQGKK